MLTKEQILQQCLANAKASSKNKRATMLIDEMALLGSYREAIFDAMDEWRDQDFATVKRLCIQTLATLQELVPLIKDALKSKGSR